MIVQGEWLSDVEPIKLPPCNRILIPATDVEMVEFSPIQPMTEEEPTNGRPQGTVAAPSTTDAAGVASTET